MSVYASRWALDFLARTDELGPTARSCMTILAAEANHRTGVAKTSQARLAEILHKHPDTVYRALRELADWVPMKRAAGKATRWFFPVSATVHTPRVEEPAALSTPPAPTVHNPPRERGGSLSTPPRVALHTPTRRRGT